MLRESHLVANDNNWRCPLLKFQQPVGECSVKYIPWQKLEMQKKKNISQGSDANDNDNK